jgi:hypothetical protein
MKENNIKTWTIRTQHKKSVVQREDWTNDTSIITKNTWYRWGAFVIESEGKTPPKLDLVNDEGIDIFTDPRIPEYEATDITTEQIEWPLDMPDDERENLKLRFDLEGFDQVMESLKGWTQVTNQMYFHGPLQLENFSGKVIRQGEITP